MHHLLRHMLVGWTQMRDTTRLAFLLILSLSALSTMLPRLPSFRLDTSPDDPKGMSTHGALMESFTPRSNVSNPLLTDLWLPWARNRKYAGDHDCHTLNYMYARYEAVCRYSWAVPCDAAIQACIRACDGKPFLELGSGTGYWAKLLAAHGVSVTAVDNGGEVRDDQPFSPYFPDAVRQDALEYLVEHEGCPDKVLFLCWPRDAEDWLGAFKGDVVVWIGEKDGCTWEMPVEDPEWKAVETVRIPTWGLIHDHLVVYVRGEALDVH
jgi:hypothetical protein